MNRVTKSLLLLLISCSPAQPREPFYPDNSAVERSLDAVVGLVDVEGYPYCAGVAWKDRILTAAHCVDDGGARVWIGYRPDDIGGIFAKSHEYITVYRDETQDIAVLNPLELSQPPEQAVLSPDNPFVGQRVVVIGHPAGLTYTVTDGVVSYTRRQRRGQVFMQVSAPVWFGSSGGPVLNRYGEVIGIISFMVHVPHLAGAVPLETLRGIDREH